MNDYFHRQIELWGEDRQKSLQNKKIAIIGSGGLGCSLGIALGSSGIGTIYCVDFDTIEIHNIHRQIAFKTSDNGKSKSEVLAQTINDRNLYVKAISKNMDFAAFVKEDIEIDLLLDATDNLHVRAEIDSYAKSKNLPWIYGSVEEFNAQACFFEKSDFSSFKIKDNQPKGIAAPMVMHIASLQANLALRYLANLSVKKDKLYYLYFDKEGELITQKFNMPKAT